jgi:hypothetical protein
VANSDGLSGIRLSGACCTPDLAEVTCAGRAGQQLNNCGQPVDCGAAGGGSTEGCGSDSERGPGLTCWDGRSPRFIIRSNRAARSFPRPGSSFRPGLVRLPARSPEADNPLSSKTMCPYSFALVRPVA